VIPSASLYSSTETKFVILINQLVKTQGRTPGFYYSTLMLMRKRF
jgi:hypothetical protein